MANTRQTFSESWHRVANLRVALRPSVDIRKQLFRGQTWYVLQDPFSNNFYRLRPEALYFVKRLQQNFTIAEIWQQCLERNPETAPGQEEVIQLLAQLHHANLLFCDLPVDSQQLFSRYKKQRQRELRSTFSNLMFLRIPLFDPSRVLDRIPLVSKLLTSRVAAMIWVLMIFLAGKALIDNAPLLAMEAKNLLNLNNLLLLYTGLLISKTAHELGHTLICRKYGGEVHSVGIMLIVFTPLPYMDATASWAFRARQQRIMVASAGMLFEFFTAACAALIWANSGPGTLHSLAFNLMVVASVSTLVFNLNPLLKYDGYYILSDLLDIPNLQDRSISQLKQVFGCWLSGQPQPAVDNGSVREKYLLFGFAMLSGGYRILVYGSIILFVADRYLLLGTSMALFCLFTWVIRPVSRFACYLLNDQRLRGRRTRILFVGSSCLAVLFGLLMFVPAPHSFRAPGILEADSLHPILTESAGQLIELPQENNERVEKGSILARLINPELAFEIAALTAQQAEVKTLLQQRIAQAGAETRDILQQQLLNLDEKLARLQQQQQQLTIVAPHGGIWFGRKSLPQKEAWLPRGSELGKLVSGKDYSFSAVISQEEAANIFSQQQLDQVGVRLNGQSSKLLKVSSYEVIPFQQQQLPSAALGWNAGGSIAVSSDDQQGLKTLEPYFRIDAVLDKTPGGTLNHGHSGQIRFDLQAKPLLQQLIRSTRQFFQQRYQL